MAGMEDRPKDSEPGERIVLGSRLDWLVCAVIVYVLVPSSASPLSDLAHWLAYGLRYAGTLILLFIIWICMRNIYLRITKKRRPANIRQAAAKRAKMALLLAVGTVMFAGLYLWKHTSFDLWMACLWAATSIFIVFVYCAHKRKLKALDSN